jgi:hypothetical protein
VTARFDLFRPIYRCRVSGASWRECVVEWATSLLEEGTDTPNLRILDGLSAASDGDEIEDYFEATLADLDQPLILELERRLGDARSIARAISAGEIEAKEGTRLMHARAVDPLEHPPLLQPWCDLDGGFIMREGLAVQLEGDALEAEIKEYAARFLAEDPDGQLQELRAQLGEDTSVG